MAITAFLPSPRRSAVRELHAHVGKRVLTVANIDPWIRSKMIEDGRRITLHNFMCALPVDVAAQVFEQAFEGRGRFPMLAFAKGFGNILAQDDWRRFKLTQRHLMPAPEADDIRNAAQKAVQGMDDRYHENAFSSTADFSRAGDLTPRTGRQKS